MGMRLHEPISSLGIQVTLCNAWYRQFKIKYLKSQWLNNVIENLIPTVCMGSLFISSPSGLCLNFIQMCSDDDASTGNEMFVNQWSVSQSSYSSCISAQFKQMNEQKELTRFRFQWQHPMHSSRGRQGGDPTLEWLDLLRDRVIA